MHKFLTRSSLKNMHLPLLVVCADPSFLASWRGCDTMALAGTVLSHISSGGSVLITGFANIPATVNMNVFCDAV